MKKILFLLFILFLSLQVSFAFSLSDLQKDDSGILKLDRYDFNSADLIKEYRNASQYSVQILHDGKAVGAGEMVTFFINGVYYTRFTDSDGVATLDINLEPGKYIVSLECNGFRGYNNILVV